MYSLRFSNVLVSRGSSLYRLLMGRIGYDVSFQIYFQQSTRFANLTCFWGLNIFLHFLTMTSITNWSLSTRGEKEDFILFSGGFLLFRNVGLWCCRCCCYSLAFVPTVVRKLSRDMRGFPYTRGTMSFLASWNKFLATRSIRRSRERAPSALIEWKYKSGSKRENSQSPSCCQWWNTRGAFPTLAVPMIHLFVPWVADVRLSGELWC